MTQPSPLPTTAEPVALEQIRASFQFIIETLRSKLSSEDLSTNVWPSLYYSYPEIMEHYREQLSLKLEADLKDRFEAILIAYDIPRTTLDWEKLVEATYAAVQKGQTITHPSGLTSHQRIAAVSMRAKRRYFEKLQLENERIHEEIVAESKALQVLVESRSAKQAAVEEQSKIIDEFVVLPDITEILTQE